MVLFSNAVIDIKMKKYDRAKQELDLMYSEKHKINDLKKIYFLKVIIACYEQDEEEIKDAELSYASNAKGETYTIVSSQTETRDGNSIRDY